MIAVDTNIIVRYFVAAEDAETALAAALIEKRLSADEQGHVSAVTLCEIIWVLRHSYRFGYDAQEAVVRLMLASVQLDVEHDDCASRALDTRHPDIADALVHFIGTKRGCSHTLTFDKKFARLEGVELLTA